jgi:hypothetical protein
MTTFIINKKWRQTSRGETWSASTHCLCGAAFRVSADSQDVVDVAVDLFLSYHQGDGHGSTDAAGAYRARAKAERATR